MKKIISLVICAALALAYAPAAVSASPGASIMRIGLHYGELALPSVNFANEIGSGYAFGYDDASRVFIPVGSTDEEKITVLRDVSMYVKSGVYYDAAVDGSTRIGAFHIQTAQAYGSFAEARDGAFALAAETGLPAFPAYIDGTYRVRLDHFSTEAFAAADVARLGLTGASVVGGSATCLTVVNTATGEILFEFDWGGQQMLQISPRSADGVRPQTWTRGYKYYGAFELRKTRDAAAITVINCVDIEDYVKGILPYEMSPSWPLEALKAQALCARTFAVVTKKHAAQGFDLCTTVDCQVYRGTGNASANSDRAVDETAGMFITYNGQPIEAVYHSSNGGSTENSKNVWTVELPYLQPVTDNYEDLQLARAIWSIEITSDELTTILQSKGYGNGKIVSMRIDEFTPTGNVYRLIMTDASGKEFVFEKERVRTIFNNVIEGINVRSMRYTIITGGDASVFVNDGKSALGKPLGSTYAIGAKGIVSLLPAKTSDIHVMTSKGVSVLSGSGTGGASGTYTISGRGWGHGLGMSQWGARGMAERGFTYDQIVRFYYTGVTISRRD